MNVKELLNRVITVVLGCVLMLGSLNPISVKAATSKDLNLIKVTRESESSDLKDVTYNNDKVYVAVGDDGTVLRSTTGLDWDTIYLQSTNNLKAIVTNGKDFVAVGEKGIILTSSNGKSWTKGKISFNKKDTYEKIVGSKRKSYIEEDYKISWSKIPKQSELELRDVVWDGKKYIAIGQWKVYTGTIKKGSYVTQPHTYLYGEFILTSKDGKKWSANFFEAFGKATDYYDFKGIEKVIYTGTEYVVTSENNIAFSSDLKKWSITSPKLRGTITDIIYENGKYVLIGWDGSLDSMAGTIYTSKDGRKWKQVINPTNLGSLTHTVDDTIEKYGVANGFSNMIMYNIIWDGSKYVICGYGGMILTSESGNKWELLNRWDVTTRPFGFSENNGERANLFRILYDGQQYIQVGTNGTILVSEDLEKGIVARTRPEIEFVELAFDGESRYFAYGYEGDMWESNNGYNWNEMELESNGKLSWEGVIGNKGTVIIICREKNSNGNYGNCFYYYSDKPGDWTKMTFPKKVSYVMGCQYLKGKFYLFTGEGLITSTDGKSWSGFSLKNTNLKKVVYNGKIYIGHRGHTNKVPFEDALYTSKDFKKWTPVTIKQEGEKFYLNAKTVVWTGKQFVTIGGSISQVGASYGDPVVATSSDGIKWKIKETDHEFEYGVYGNKTFLALDYYGNVHISTNGKDYKKISKATSQEMVTALWDGKKFLLAGEMGVILSSRKSKDTVIPKSEKWIEKKEAYTLGYK